MGKSYTLTEQSLGFGKRELTRSLCNGTTITCTATIVRVFSKKTNLALTAIKAYQEYESQKTA